MEQTGWLSKSHAGLPYAKHPVRRFCTTTGFQVTYYKQQERNQRTGRFDLRQVERLTAVTVGASPGVSLKVKDRTKSLTVVFSEGQADAWLQLWASAVAPSALCDALAARRDPELAAALDLKYGAQLAFKARAVGYASPDSLFSPRDATVKVQSTPRFEAEPNSAAVPLTAPASSTPAPAVPLAAFTSAPAPVVGNDADDDAADVFIVTVPEGCRPGDKLRATDPYGAKLIIEVPQGATPGSQLEYVKPSAAKPARAVLFEEGGAEAEAALEAFGHGAQARGVGDEVVEAQPSGGAAPAPSAPQPFFMRCVPPSQLTKCLPGGEARRAAEFEAALNAGELDMATELAQGETEAARLCAAREREAEFVNAIRAYDWEKAKALAASQQEKEDLVDSIVRVKYLDYYKTSGDKDKALEIAITEAEIEAVQTAIP